MNDELFKKFTDGTAVINCQTKQEAESFMILLHKKHIKWYSSRETIGNSYWDNYEKRTVYYCDCYKVLTYGETICVDDEEIITYKELMSDCYMCSIFNTCSKEVCIK